MTQLRRILELGGSVFVDMTESDLKSLMEDKNMQEEVVS